METVRWPLVGDMLRHDPKTRLLNEDVAAAMANDPQISGDDCGSAPRAAAKSAAILGVVRPSAKSEPRSLESRRVHRSGLRGERCRRTTLSGEGWVFAGGPRRLGLGTEKRLG